MLLFGLLVCGFIMGDLVYGQVPDITGITMLKCGKKRVVYQGETFEECWARGPGIATALSASVSGSGVTAEIIERVPLVQTAPPKGKIKIKFTVTGSASTTRRKVTVTGPLWSDTFRIYIKSKAKITGATVPSFEGFFQNNVDVTLTGKRISSIKIVGITVLSDAFHPVIGENGNPTSASVTASLKPGSNTSTKAVIRLNFGSKLQEATVRIRLFGGNSDACSGLRAHQSTALTYDVKIKAAPYSQNYVQEHIFDRNNRTYKVGDIVSVTIKLAKPAKNPLLAAKNLRITPSRRKRGSRGGRLTKPGEQVYWTLLPSDKFQKAGPSGTPYNANAHHNVITVPAGSRTATITFQVAECPGSGFTNTVKLITWKPDSDDDSFPNRKEVPFTINCRP